MKSLRLVTLWPGIAAILFAVSALTGRAQAAELGCLANGLLPVFAEMRQYDLPRKPARALGGGVRWQVGRER